MWVVVAIDQAVRRLTPYGGSDVEPFKSQDEDKNQCDLSLNS